MMSTATTRDLSTIDASQLASVHGGMKWQSFCASYNVEDRRPGAGTPAQQRARTDQWNRERGCPTWADLHPSPKRR